MTRLRLTGGPTPPRTPSVSGEEIDAYLARLEEPQRGTLGELRRTLRAVLPDAEEGISYGMPAFRVGGRVVAGFAAFRHHLSYLPHSGSVLGELAEDLAGYEMTLGALHFPVDTPLPRALVEKLVAVRLRDLEQRPARRRRSGG